MLVDSAINYVPSYASVVQVGVIQFDNETSHA